MKLRVLLLLLLLVASNSLSASAEETKASPTPVVITVTEVWVDGGRIPAPTPSPTASPSPSPGPSSSLATNVSAPPDQIFTHAGLRDRIWVEVDRLSEAIEKDKINPRELVLYLNGEEVKGMKPVAFKGPKQNWLGFDLVRNADSDPVWRNLLGSPTKDYRPVEVSVGFPGKGPIPVTAGKPWHPFMYLRMYYPRWVFIAIAGLALIVLFFVLWARQGGLIHDSNPPAPPDGKMKPYSLGLTQAAWWFFVVFGSFVFIYLITGDYNTITEQALILIGLGTGTALGAFMINASKSDTADGQLSTLRPEEAHLDAEVQQLTAKDTEIKARIAATGAAAAADDQSALRDNGVVLADKKARLDEVRKQIEDAEAGQSKPVSEGFRKDILTDVNGIALHRFQMVVWTIAVGLMFIVGVYRNLSMPEFSATLLALMGISAGTYLGFKIPERQTDPKKNP